MSGHASLAVTAARVASVVLGAVTILVLVGALIGNDTLVLIGGVAMITAALIDGVLWWRARSSQT